MNDDRSVYYQKAKTWINDFNSLNNSNKPLFTPTTVMEIGNKKYLFVIDEAKLNNDDRVVFKVSTKEIKLSEKKMLKLPCGDHDGVRFDIDDNGCWWCQSGKLTSQTALYAALNLGSGALYIFTTFYWKPVGTGSTYNALFTWDLDNEYPAFFPTSQKYAFARCADSSGGDIGFMALTHDQLINSGDFWNTLVSSGFATYYSMGA